MKIIAVYLFAVMDIERKLRNRNMKTKLSIEQLFDREAEKFGFKVVTIKELIDGKPKAHISKKSVSVSDLLVSAFKADGWDRVELKAMPEDKVRKMAKVARKNPKSS